ncbi:hypothetical protein GQ42DRAFT_72088 [Ramicandelaber brevisporus]|nr:hypothetical protein GQ42DRAFT_72088 [Ramicandelaber brevisporus]
MLCSSTTIAPTGTFSFAFSFSFSFTFTLFPFPFLLHCYTLLYTAIHSSTATRSVRSVCSVRSIHSFSIHSLIIDTTHLFAAIIASYFANFRQTHPCAK